MSDTNEDPEVRLGYGSSQNITFYGVWETGYKRSEWDKLSEEAKNRVFDEAVYDLVEIYELRDDEDAPDGTF